MAHYALLDNNNIVVKIIVGKNENENGIDWEQYYTTSSGYVAKRTSYNTTDGKHWTKGEISNDQSSSFRGNYATIGGIYNEEFDIFVDSKPYPSWTLTSSSYQWQPPVPYPEGDATGSFTGSYSWNEVDQQWDQVVL